MKIKKKTKKKTKKKIKKVEIENLLLRTKNNVSFLWVGLIYCGSFLVIMIMFYIFKPTYINKCQSYDIPEGNKKGFSNIVPDHCREYGD